MGAKLLNERLLEDFDFFDVVEPLWSGCAYLRNACVFMDVLEERLLCFECFASLRVLDE